MAAPWAGGTLSREQLALNDLARIPLPVLLDAGHGVPELEFALLDGPVMLPLVLLPDLVPLARVLGLVGFVTELEGEILLDELEPYLAGAALDLGRVDLDAAQLMGILNSEEYVSYIFVGEVVADTVQLADVLNAGQGGQIHKRADGHGEYG